MSTKPANEARAEIALPTDHPMMKAWNAFCETDEFKNALRWARETKYDDGRPIDFIQQEQHTKGALWLAFTKGMEAEQPHPASPADAGDAMRVVEALEWMMGSECPCYAGHDQNVYLNFIVQVKMKAMELLPVARRLLDAPPGVGERMPDDGKEWYEWVEPSGAADNSPVYLRVSRATAIGMQKASLKEGKSYKSDHRALDDFVVVHWAQKVAAPASAEPERAKAGE